MADPTLTISIDRTSLDLAAFVLTGHDAAHDLAITDYQEPAMAPRNEYAPTSPDVDGEMPLGWSWQQSILGFSVVKDDAVTEAAMRTKIVELVAAVARLSFTITVTVSDAPAETWTAQGAGSVVPVGGRTYEDMRHHDPVWSVSIPVHPVRSVS